MYRNIQAFAFKVLHECSSWASRNGAAQIFFLIPNWNIFSEKFVKSERFLAVLREHIIFNVTWVDFRKMSGVFEQDCIVKSVIFFASFCWNFQKKKLWWCPLKHLDKYKNVYPKQHFQKMNSKYEGLYLYFGPNFFGTTLGHFSQCFFLISHRRPTKCKGNLNQVLHVPL